MTRTVRHARPHSHAWGRRSVILLLCLGACTLERAGQGHDAIREPAEQTPSSEPQNPGSIDAGDAADAGDPDRVQDPGMAPGDAGGEPARDAGQPVKDAGQPVKDAGAVDLCPADPKKTAPGVCGCGAIDRDTASACLCPATSLKKLAALCGCDVPDTDSDGDTVPDCRDACPSDARKVTPGDCGCGQEERDSDRDKDGVVDCQDACPRDPAKRKPGVCGCGKPDADGDRNGTPDCLDGMRRRAEVPSAKRAPVLAQVVAVRPRVARAWLALA